jgi:riboflavin synthase
MFTGIVEETGIITQIEPRLNSIRLVVHAKECAVDSRTGDSIAVNGCCLTLVQKRTVRDKALLSFDLLQETWNRTSFSQAAVGHPVNLERALAVGSRLGGHFVTGHIDGTGLITQWKRIGKDHQLDISAPADILRYVVFKGSIAVDGISLTVADLIPKGFRIWIIPHTHEVTSLKGRQVGDRVNLEADLLGKYVDQLLAKRLDPVSKRKPKNSR